MLLGAVLLTYQFVAPAPIGAAENARGEAAPSSADSPSSVGTILQSAPSPPNDDFDDATEISALPFSDVVDTAGATIALDDPDLGCADTDEPNSVWYRLVLSADVFLQVDTFGSDYGTALAVFTGDRGSLSEVACNSNAGGAQSAVQFPAQAGVTYMIEVIQFGSSEGGALQLNAAEAITPENDDFDGAMEIPGLPFPGFQFTYLATSADDDPSLSCGQSPASAYSNSVWFRYPSPADGGITIEILDRSYDTIIAAWTGQRGELSEVGCNDLEWGAEADAYLTIPVVGGQDYWIEVVSQGSPSGGLLELEVREAFPPAHDDFNAAVQIASFVFAEDVDTSLATTADDDPAPTCGASSPPQQSHSVWYRHTPSQQEAVEVGIASAHDAVLAVWTGQQGSLSQVHCLEYPAGFDLSTVFLDGGVTYWLEFTIRGQAAGGLLNIMLNLVPPPPNDDFDDATIISELPFSDLLDTRGAVTASDDPSPTCGAPIPPTQSNTVWYSFAPVRDGAVRLREDLNRYETVAAIWTGTRGALTEVACAHHPGWIDPFLVLPVQAGTTYFIEFAQYGSPGGGRLGIGVRQEPASECVGALCTFYIEAGSDDAGSIPQPAPLQPCTFYTGEGNIYLGQCTNGDPITSGFRFTGVDIAPGSVVLEAYLEFVRDGPYTDALDLEIHAEDSSHPETFSDSSRPGQRPLISAEVPWPIPETEPWELGETGRTPDIGALVQAVVDRPDWAAGSSLALIVTNAGPASGPNLHRRFLGFDRAILDFDYDQPRLIVKLGVPDPDQSTISVEPTTIIADGVDSGLVTVEVLTATGIPLPNVSVALQATPEAGVLINGAPAGSAPVPIGVTDTSGTITATIASTQLGEVTLSALANSVALNQSAVVHFVTRITDPSQSTLAINPTTLPADGITPAVATVTLLDAAGLPVALHEVELQVTGVAAQVTLPDPPVTDADGEIVGYIRSVEAGLATVRAVDLTAGVTLDQAVELTFTIGSTDPVRSTVAVTPTSLTADGIQAAAITATIVDNQGRALPGHQLRLNVSGSGNAIGGLNPATSDAAGQAAWTLTSTKAEVKSLSVVDQTAGVTLAQRPQLTFNPGPLDPAHSLVTPATLFGAADGATPVSVVVRAYDAFNNPIPGLSVQLFTTRNAIVTQPADPTDSQGRATGTVVDAVAEQVTLSATLEGQLIPDQGRVTFRGAELSLAKTGQALSNYDGLSDAFALAGGTITYTLSVTNQGPLDAAGVEVVDTLPAGLTFAYSGLPHQVDGQSITWQVGDLAAGGSIQVSFEAEIEAAVLGIVTNSAAVSTTTTEFELSDNAAGLDTTVEAPRPVMKLIPAGPTLTVLQGESAALTPTLRNSGAAEMTGIQVTSPPTIPWVSLDLSALTDLAPRSEATFTVTASPPADQTPGLYRDFIVARDDFGNQQRIALTVRVETPRRVMQIVAENDQGARVPGATVNLVKQEASVVVTEGAVQTFHESVQAKANAGGIAGFGALQIGAYDVTASAPDHNPFSGSLTVVEGPDIQTVTIRMTARGRIELSPDSPVIGVVRGQVASRTISIVNRGAAALTGLSISPPAAIPWVTVASASPIPAVPPGGSLSFSLIASPSATQAGDIFQDFVTVNADGGLSTQLALTVQLAAEGLRDVQVTVVDESDAPVGGGGEVVLVEQNLTTLQLPGGETRTFNQQLTASLDPGGTASFTGLEPGAYNYLAAPHGYTRETGELLIQPGSGVQAVRLASSLDPFSYTWTVVPIQQGYEITLTLTYDVTTPKPVLLLPEVCWPGNTPGSETIVLHNPTLLPLSLEDLRVSVPGAEVVFGDLPSVIPPDTLLDLPVQVTKTGTLGTGTLEADYSWQAAPDKFVTFTFNPSSKTSQLLLPGSLYQSDYTLDPSIFDPSTNYTITVGQPSILDWITLSPDQTGPMQFTGGTQIHVAMSAATPLFLAEGIYQDSAPIRVDGDDGTYREGGLEFEVTRTPEGMFLHTSFVLGDIPTETRNDTASGTITTGMCTEWRWSSTPGTYRLRGTASGRGVGFPGFSGGPVYGFDHQQVRMEIKQKVMLEGEGFLASLGLTNTSAQPIDLVSVDIRMTDLAGADRSPGFEFVPETPTPLGTIPVGGSTNQDWLILPSRLGVTSPEGEGFDAQALITYTWGGDTYTVATVPERVTVYPAPDLVITYQLPLPDIPCTTFPLKVTVQNRGRGPARNLRFSTALPVLTDPLNGRAIPFDITRTTVNGEPRGAELDLQLGDVPPDGEAVIVWQLETTRPGRFIEFTSDYRQSNFLDVPLSPLISEIHTFLVPGACGGVPDEAVLCPSGECPGIALQGTQGLVAGPINTRTGGVSFNASDFSFPTSAGPLTFERWYASQATGLYTQTLGFGWTHSLESRLYFPGDPTGKEGSVLLKLHSANRFEFFETAPGVYTAYPGVCGTLVRQEGPPVSYTFTDDAQRVYLFDEDGRLRALADPQGNALHYLYDADGRLQRVEDDSGTRYLLFAYDADGRLEWVADYAGRQVSYAYDPVTGDLVSATDVLGQAWTYVYDSEHRMLQAVDPRGVIIERSEYDGQGRAVRQFDGEGNRIVELAYNADGTTTVRDAVGNEQTHRYDDRGALVDQIDPLGNAAEKTYDPNFRPSVLTDPAGNATQLDWSDDGANLAEVTDASGATTQLNYDELNNLTGVTDTSGNSSTFTYDGALLISSTDALGNTTTYTYTDADDAPAPAGMVETITDTLGNTTAYAYNDFGQRTSMTDALGSTTIFVYDDLGRLVETVDSLGRVNRNLYDAAGRLARLIRNHDPLRAQNEDAQWNITTAYVYDAAGNTTEITDTFNRTTRYTYDENNWVVVVTDPADQRTEMTYDAAGNLVEVKDPLGRITVYEYDELNRVVKVIDALNGETLTTYDDNGNVADTTDASGNTTTFEYDELNRPVAVIDALNGRSTTEYDAVGNVVATTDAGGRTTTYAYDALNRLVRQTDPEGGVTQIFYDQVGNRVRTIDPNGGETHYEYDGLNRLVGVTDALGGTSEYSYDEVGNQVAVSDANGNTTSFEYDELSRRVAVIDALSGRSKTEYDALGSVLATLDGLGNRTSYAYDLLNRLVAQTDPLGGRTSYSYDAVGNQLSFTDANDHTTTTAYDELNRPIQSNDPNGQVSRTGYDAAGNVQTLTNALNETTVFAFDALYRQVSMTDPLGNVTRYEYDEVGNRVGVTDAEGVATRYEYDRTNRLTAVVENYRAGFEPNNETNVRTEYGYDANGNRLTILDGNRHTTTFDYDALGRMVQERDALGNTTIYGYDAVGNRVSLTDANGFTTSFVFDDLSRLIEINYPETDPDVKFTYNAVGSRTQMVDGVGTTRWVYDPLYRSTAVTDPFGGTVGYGYDAVGNRTLLTYPDGKTVDYAYDASDRMTQVTDWESQTSAYSYDLANRLIETVPANGVNSSYDYDTAGRLLEIQHRTATDLLSSFSYTYDVVGNRTQAFEVMSWPGQPQPVADYGKPIPLAALPVPSRNSSVPVDPLTAGLAPFGLLVLIPLMRRRELRHPYLVIVLVVIAGAGLAACTFPIPTPPPLPTSTPTVTATSTATPIIPTATFTPTYTPTPTDTPTPTPEPIVVTTTTIDYSYDPLYRLAAADYSSGEFFHYAYDAVGNRLTQGTLSGMSTYTYDAANRLTSVDGVAYSWDANGNMLDDGSRAYTYDHANRLTSVVQGGNAYEFDYTGLGDRLRQTVNGNATEYTLDIETGLTQVLSDGGTDFLYGGGRIAQLGASGRDYFLGDALNSVRQLVNDIGQTRLGRAYEPFGGVLSTTGGIDTSYGFTGEWRDETGLTFLRTRYYEPAVGRFINKDPSRLEAGLYVYSAGNPINFTDPSGLWRWWPAITEDPDIPVLFTYHWEVENHYEGTLFGAVNPAKQLEYIIPGTPRRRPDMFNSMTGDLYEVEPWFLANSPRHGAVQAAGYVTDLLAAASKGELTGTYGLVAAYDWNLTPYHLGTGVDWPGKLQMPMPGFPYVDLVADYTGPGVIQYWFEPNAIGLGALAASLPLIVPNKRLVRPQNWQPGTPVYQPAYVLSLAEGCAYAVVAVGGTIIVVTILEDVFTLGVGLFDDALTVPVGLLFINLGQRMAVPVPVMVR